MGFDYDFILLKGKNISGCIACLGCVKDSVCKVEDDLLPPRDKIVDADMLMCLDLPTIFLF